VLLTPFLLKGKEIGVKLGVVTILLLLISFTGSVLRPFYFEPVTLKTPTTHAIPFSILYGSIQSSETEDDWLHSLVYDKNPTFIGLRGVNLLEREQAIAKQLYPYSVTDLGYDSSYGKAGIGIYSRLPIVELTEGDPGKGVVMASVKDPSFKDLVLVLIDTPSGWNEDDIYDRKVLLKRLASYFRQREDNVILFGNFATTPFTWDYKQFQSEGVFLDAAYGHGYLSTTSELGPLGYFPLDYFLYAGDLSVREFTLPKRANNRSALFGKFAIW